MRPRTLSSVRQVCVFARMADSSLPHATKMYPLRGTLHTYGDNPTLSAFAHDAGDTRKIVLLVTGMNGTLPAVDYANDLAEALAEIGWQLVQPMLRSSGGGWGGCSIMEDAEDLSRCVAYFQEEGATSVVLMGHSTGKYVSYLQTCCCAYILASPGTQDTIAYHHMLRSFPMPKINASILQAPVSDRECLHAMAPDLDVPSPLQPPEGSSLDSFIPRHLSSLWGTRSGITYKRWNSITAKAESDAIDLAACEDFFSSDMSETRWRNVFEPVKTPMLVLLSDRDESYPSHVAADDMLAKFRKALGEDRWSQDSRVLKDADHAVTEEEARVALIESVTAFLKRLP